MTTENFMNEIVALYHKYFKDSLCKVNLWSALGKKDIWIDCYLAKDAKECSYNQMANDMFKLKMQIESSSNLSLDSKLSDDTLTLKFLSKSFMVKPTVDCLYCDYKTISVRKTTGNDEKILKTLDKTFKKMYDAVTEAVHNNETMEKFNELIKQKLVIE